MLTFNKEQEQRIFKAYVVDGESTSSLAKEYKTSPKRISDIVKKLGGKIRTKAEAQALALKNNRSTHPTKGKPRDASVKKLISERLVSSWQKLSPDDYEKRVDGAKERWAAIPADEREDMCKAGAEAIRLASKEGSKLEKVVHEELVSLGHIVIYHRKGLIINDNLELDIYLPGLKTAIEIDGPSHYLPIWGEEKFQKHIQADQEKNTLLIREGYNIVRIKCIERTTSQNFKRLLMKKIVQTLEEIKASTEANCYLVDPLE